jgi:hypothetical protein
LIATWPSPNMHLNCRTEVFTGPPPNSMVERADWFHYWLIEPFYVMPSSQRKGLAEEWSRLVTPEFHAHKCFWCSQKLPEAIRQITPKNPGLLSELDPFLLIQQWGGFCCWHMRLGSL